MPNHSQIEQINAGSFSFLDIIADSPEYYESETTHTRISLPPDRKTFSKLGAKGFFFADRTLDVMVIPSRTKIDYKQHVRFNTEIAVKSTSEINKLAYKSFPFDSRFHIKSKPDQALAETIIDTWIKQTDEFLICYIKEELAGFLALKIKKPKSLSIHLAAVHDKFKPAGVALSIYSSAILRALELGVQTIVGTISSQNIPVINLYSALGGTFSNPRDVFLKEA